MEIPYLPLSERTADYQYLDRLLEIKNEGVLARDTPQGVGALTCFASTAPMVFDIRNGVPLITERNCKGFWRKAVAEIIAFINGARTIDEIRAYGCDFWDAYEGKGSQLGLEPNDMGPGSYGPAFHDYPLPSGSMMNQLANLVDQIREYPNIRTHRVITWIPAYTQRGPNRKVIVAPCHGDLYVRMLDGKLNLAMVQRSADVPIGVPSNMIQYSALFLMLCQVLGYQPGYYSHLLIDAHIYENQLPGVDTLLERQPRPFPILRLDPGVTDLFDFRAHHFELEEYDPNPGIKIPFAP